MSNAIHREIRAATLLLFIMHTEKSTILHPTIITKKALTTEKIITDLRKLREDKNIKAVVYVSILREEAHTVLNRSGEKSSYLRKKSLSSYPWETMQHPEVIISRVPLTGL